MHLRDISTGTDNAFAGTSKPSAFLKLWPAFLALSRTLVVAFFLDKFYSIFSFLESFYLTTVTWTDYYIAHVIKVHQNREDFPPSPLVCRLYRAQYSSPLCPQVCRTCLQP